MEATHDFLLALGLDEGADERAIRRAYAKRLKGIDQARDAAGFQALRDAYEAAMDWAQYQQEMAQEAQPLRQDDGQAEVLADVPAAGPDADPVPPEYADAPDPAASEAAHALTAVWERFLADMARITAAHQLADVDAWQEALRARLADEELINLEARMQFEWRIVSILGSGWRPGHESLFPAAIAVFGWEQERRGLAQFGYYGNLLNQAVDERAVFFAQELMVRSVQQRITMLLRREKQADTTEVVHSMAELRSMQARFPALLFVVTNPENVAHWETTFAAHEPALPREKTPREKAASWFLRIVIVSLVFAFLRFLYGVESLAPAPKATRHQAAQESGAAPRAKPPTREVLEAHLAPVVYELPAHARSGDYTVNFSVTIDAAGKVVKLTTLQASTLPGFDAAVEAAIRSAKPFPPGTARVFGVGMTAHIAPKPPRTRAPGKKIQS